MRWAPRLLLDDGRVVEEGAEGHVLEPEERPPATVPGQGALESIALHSSQARVVLFAVAVVALVLASAFLTKRNVPTS